jgi:hypothetical protein
MFDVTIVSQSFIYTRKAHHRHSRARRKNTLVPGHDISEEEAALLGADVLARSFDSLARSKHRESPSRTRTYSVDRS